jgi:hypothetical protein
MVTPATRAACQANGTSATCQANGTSAARRPPTQDGECRPSSSRAPCGHGSVPRWRTCSRSETSSGKSDALGFVSPTKTAGGQCHAAKQTAVGANARSSSVRCNAAARAIGSWASVAAGVGAAAPIIPAAIASWHRRNRSWLARAWACATACCPECWCLCGNGVARPRGEIVTGAGWCSCRCTITCDAAGRTWCVGART